MIRCYDCEGRCFARRDGNRCEILTKPFLPCSFKKPERLVTNGVFYPYNPRRCAVTDGQAKELEERWNE